MVLKPKAPAARLKILPRDPKCLQELIWNVHPIHTASLDCFGASSELAWRLRLSTTSPLELIKEVQAGVPVNSVQARHYLDVAVLEDCGKGGEGLRASFFFFFFFLFFFKRLAHSRGKICIRVPEAKDMYTSPGGQRTP
jgi:hypothetical protein